MKLNIHLIKKFTGIVIILQFAISLKSYSEVIKTNNSKELKWELLKKNDNKNLGGNIKWETVPNSENDGEVFNRYEKIFKSPIKRIYKKRNYEINPIFPLNNFINIYAYLPSKKTVPFLNMCSMH